jgi:hypothetical protein
MGGDALGADHFEDRILYRLETREIIDRKEFQRRFPDGWKPKDKPQNEDATQSK